MRGFDLTEEPLTSEEYEQLNEELEEIKVSCKTEEDDFSVEFDIVPIFDISSSQKYSTQKENIEQIEEDSYKNIENLNKKIDTLNIDIDRLTNHADGLDYAIAVTSGVITGMIDAFIIGEWNFKSAKSISNRKVNTKVLEFAKKNGFDPNKYKSSEKLSSAIKFLENKFQLPGDGAYQINRAGLQINEHTHHLDDFCHHPTLVGLICSIIVQFTGSTVYVNKGGDVINLPITVNEYGNFIGKNPVTKLFSGIINWFFQVAKTIANQKGHLLSDMAGSHASSGKGTGIPGSLMSVMNELSALPCFRSSDFGENLRKAFQNGIGTSKSQIDLGAFNSLFEGASSKFDKRTEMAIGYELKRQVIPVVINEMLVRGFYFVRHFIAEMKNVDSILDITWGNVLPIKNRTIVRMITISSGAFMAIDLADSAIRSLVKNGPPTINPLFWKDFILRANFVGIGRFAIAVATDVGMGVKKNNLDFDRKKLQVLREFEKNTVIQCEVCKVQVELSEAYELIEEITNQTILKLQESEAMEEKSFKKIEEAEELLKEAMKDF
jgi:hypothetical protein